MTACWGCPAPPGGCEPRAPRCARPPGGPGRRKPSFPGQRQCGRRHRAGRGRRHPGRQPPPPGPSTRGRERPRPRCLPPPVPGSAGREGRRCPHSPFAYLPWTSPGQTGAAHPLSALSHHAPDLSPRHRDGSESQGTVPGPLRNVVVSLVGTVGPVLEPLSLHAHAGGKGVELLVGVGQEVGPPVIYRPEAGRLPPVVQIDGHRPSGSGLR